MNLDTSLAMLLFVTGVSCAKAAPPPLPCAPAAKRDALISVAPELLSSGRIRAEKPERRRVSSFIVASGQIEAPPDAAAAITAPVSARVRDIEVRRGDRVQRGQRLARLDAGEVARVTSDLERSRARRVHAEKVLMQEQKLRSEGATSERALSDAQSALDAARADETAASTLLANFGAGRGGEMVLTSPIDGVVVRIEGVVGAPVQATAPLFRVVDPSRLLVRADVPESDADEVPEGASALVTSMSAATRCPARVESHAPAVEASTRTVPFRVRLDAGCAEFHEGAFVDVSIQRAAATGHELLTVPRDAVVSIDDVPNVFVAAEVAGKFRAKTVRIAEYGGPVAFVEDGLDVNDRIVNQGALLLKGELVRARLE